MKLILLSLLFPVLVYASVGTTKVITVYGMVCDYCSRGIEKKFKTETAVKKIWVSLDEKTVKLTFKKGLVLSDLRIREIFKQMSYDVVSIQ